MTERAKAAIIIELARRLRDRGSWCGETHLQKTTYFLQEMLGVPTEFEFVLYKYGPYAFDLHDQLRVMRTRGFVSNERQPYPYGPRLAVTPLGDGLRERFPKTIRRYDRPIAFVANEFGTKGVTELEQLATAYLVTVEEAENSVDGRAQLLRDLKPHIPAEVARRAVVDVDRLRAEAHEFRVCHAPGHAA